MRLQLHPTSLAVGVGVTLLAVVTMAQGTVSNRTQVPVVPGLEEELRRPPGAEPVSYTDYVFITNTNFAGTPDYIVPVGKALILTGVMNRGVQTSVGPKILVGPPGNSTQIVWTSVGLGTGGTDPLTQSFRIGPVTGYPVRAGEGVEIVNVPWIKAVWVVGYLVDE